MTTTLFFFHEIATGILIYSNNRFEDLFSTLKIQNSDVFLFRTCVLEKRHIIGGAAVTEEIVPGFKFSRASYLLSLLRPQIMTDLELKKHGLKVNYKNVNCATLESAIDVGQGINIGP